MKATHRDLLPAIHALADSAAWALAIWAAWWIRFDFVAADVDMGLVASMTAIAVGVQIMVGTLLGLYRRWWRYGSFEEFGALAVTMLAVAVALFATDAAVGTIPNSIPYSAAAYAVLLAVAGRSAWRLFRARKSQHQEAEPIIVIGAGDAAEQIVRALSTSSDAPYRPVALVDDDRHKASLRLIGVRVRGTIDDLPRLADELGVRTALFAIPSADAALRRRVASFTGLQLLSLPSVTDMFEQPQITDIAPVTPDDLLGRPPADIDTAAVAAYVTGKRVLVTGAGGSIGSELCRQLARFAPAALVMLDRDESGLHATQLSIDGHGLLTDPNLVLADMRDAERMDEVFATHRPEVVFHAAALKHLTLLENHPVEAWKTNVEGTWNVLSAARRHGVARFVNISSDKAADPVCVLGYTKRITERLTAAVADGSQYLSVRFGNVLGSRGSVLTAFDAQARSGGPITLTHRAATRYFMTIAEAVTLTIYAGAIGGGREVLVLDMGEPVAIAEIAERYARRVDPPVEIVEMGLRPGEKLHEVLFGVDEVDDRREHPLISHVPVPPLSYHRCAKFWCTESTTATSLIEALGRLAAETAPVEPETNDHLRRSVELVSQSQVVNS